MNDSRHRIIVVTGAPRSGTTAVGQMLALGRGVGTLHEPLNYLVGLRDIDRYFEIPGTGSCSVDKFDTWIRRIRALDLAYKPGVFPKETGLRRVLKRLAGGRARNSYRQCRLTPFLNTIIWKDPFACFAADLLTEFYKTDVLVTLRNPWAVAGSFKRMRWAFDLDDLTERLGAKGLVRSNLAGDVWRRRQESAVNGAILWHLIYSTLAEWATDNPRLRFVNLDDIVDAPRATYAELYRALGLPWSDRIARKIESQYAQQADNALPAASKAHDSNRDLRAINTYWQRLLDPDEAEVITALNGDVWTALSSRHAGGKSAPRSSAGNDHRNTGATA